MTSTAQPSTLDFSANARTDSIIGLAPIMTMACNGVDLSPLGQNLLERANRAAGTERANALMDVATILQMKGDAPLALAIQEQALELSQVFRLACKRPSTVRLLIVMCPGAVGANTPLEFLLEDSDVEVSFLYLSAETALPDRIPEHDILFIAVGYCEQRFEILQWIERLFSSWPRPILNRPRQICHLSRDSASQLLQSIPGAVVPRVVRVERRVLEQSTGNVAQLEFPIIVRPVDSHAGIDLAKADDIASLREYLSLTAGDYFYIAPFIDYRSVDGQFRKYRVAFVDGRPYAGHMAISENWIIHYLSGGMDVDAAKRAEETRFISTFDEDFARRHKQPLHSIVERVGLDYLIMDCAETRDGQLLVFEIDNNAVIHAMDPPETFPYKKPQLEKIAASFRAMLLNRI